MNATLSSELPPEPARSGSTDSLPAVISRVPVARPESSPRQIPAGIRLLPFTTLLIAINVLVYAAMVFSGVSPLEPTTGQLAHWGANYGPLTISSQPWRLLSSAFVHIGIVHLALNMWCLWNLGLLGEEIYGGWIFLGVYLLSAVGGSVASIARNPLVVSAGASGAIFGLAGALIATFKFGNLPLAPSVLRAILRSLVAFAGYNLLFGMLYGRIDNAAHVGGLLCGLVLGTTLSRYIQFPARRKISPAALVIFPAAILLLGGAGYSVRQWRLPKLHVQLAQEAMSRGDVRSAVGELQAALRVRPSYAPAHEALGNIFMLAGRYAQAEGEYQRVLALDPSNIAVRKKLALTYAQSKKTNEAVQLFREVTTQSPADAEAFYDLGLVLHQAGRDREAISPLSRAASLRPRSASAPYLLGLCYMGLRQYDDAISAFQKALSIQPNASEPYIAMANAYEAKGMKSEADSAYAKAYELRQQKAQARKQGPAPPAR